VKEEDKNILIGDIHCSSDAGVRRPRQIIHLPDQAEVSASIASAALRILRPVTRVTPAVDPVSIAVHRPVTKVTQAASKPSGPASRRASSRLISLFLIR
jgi:hypothetical protein